MSDLQGILDFADQLTGGVLLVGFALAAGSVLWVAVILRPWSKTENGQEIVLLNSIRLLRLGAYVLAGSQLVDVMLKAAMLAAALDEFPLAAYLATDGFAAGVIRAVLAFALGLLCQRLLQSAYGRPAWIAAALLSIALLISGAWLVHGAGSLDDRKQLMFLTAVHQYCAAVWVGGVLQLLSLWRLSARHPAVKPFWPIALTRFSWLGIASVTLLLLTGGSLAWTYVGSWKGLFGTGYGSLVLAKAVLLSLALGLAALNFRAGRRWRRDYRSGEVSRKVPRHVETEALLLISILFIAATLSSQPPAVDIGDETASLSEVAGRFAPKLPRLTSPARGELSAVSADRLDAADNSQSEVLADAAWSDFNHNVAGLFVAVISIVAVLGYARGYAWARFWPLGFVGLSLLLFLRTDAEWPLGPMGFWESIFGDSEILQHRIGLLLAFTLGIMETRVRISTEVYTRLAYCFPLICILGGLLLLTHSHSGFQLRTEYLIQVTHAAMGLLAIVMACGRWLELRLAAPMGRLGGVVSMLAMLLIGMVLMFYREPVL